MEIISIDPNSEYNSPYYDDDNNSSCSESSSSCDDCSFDDDSAEDFTDEESESEETSFNDSKFSILLSPKTINMEANGSELYVMKSIENRDSDRDVNIDLVSTPGKYLNSNIFDRVFDCCDNILTGNNMDIDLDVKNFDLTTYITEDDCNLPATRVIQSTKKRPVLKTKPIRISSGKPSNYKKITNRQYSYNKNMKFNTESDTDSEDSDESVDVETICDNIIKSPEKLIIKTENVDDCILEDPTYNHTILNVTKNSGTNSQKILSSTAASTQASANFQDENTDHDYYSPKKPNRLIKEEYPIENNFKSNIVNKESNIELNCIKVEDKQNLKEHLITNIISESVVSNVNTNNKLLKTGKRKLNLQEYKQRRGNPNFPSSQRIDSQNDTLNYHVSTNDSVVNEISINLRASVNKTKQPKNVDTANQILDPILEASRKAIRNQELKKAEIIKKSEPVIRVQDHISILPLAEINSQYEAIKEAKEKQNLQKLKINPNFEEIVIVSIGCNTNLTIPAQNSHLTCNETEQNMMLLYNISDTIKKANSCGEHIVISSNSLISSIKDVVLKINNPPTGIPETQTSPNIGVSPPKNVSPGKPEASNLGESVSTDVDHGEDRTIMHLRKDRVRPKSHSVSMQTEYSSIFPVLKRLSREYTSNKCTSQRKDKYTERRYRKRGISSSSESENENNKKTKCDNRRDHSSSPTRKRLSRKENNSYSKTTSPYRSVSPKYNSYKRNSDQRSISSLEARNKDRRPSSRNSIISRSSSSSNRSRSRHRHYSTSSQSSSSSFRSVSRENAHRRSLNKNQREASPGTKLNTITIFSDFFAIIYFSEERRIVYVGRIEKETSKEDLKKKFLMFGPIKQITLHYKDTG